MKRIGKQPRLLPNVMDAIANLKDKAGSTQRKIIEQVSRTYKKRKETARNMAVQIRRALKHGLNSGLIKQRSGKYLLGLDNKDYSVFKKFRKVVSDPLSGILEAKRRRRRKGGRRKSRRRRGRRRGRRHNDLVDQTDGPTESDEEGLGELMDKSRRRRRGGRRRRRSRRRRSGRRGRHGRKRYAAPDNDKHSDSATPIKSVVDVTRKLERNNREEKYEECDYQKPSTRHSSREPVRLPSRHHSCDNEGNECGNPECLCGSNPDRNEKERYMSNDTNNDFYYNDHMM